MYNKTQTLRKYTGITVIIVFMTFVFLALSAVSNIIPRERVKDNILRSADIIDGEGLKHRIGGFFLFRLDNFTDALMLNIVAGTDSSRPVSSAMKSSFHLTDDRSSVTEGTRRILSDRHEGLHCIDYERYWHGYTATLRPLLTFTDYGGIRVINYICLTALILILGTLIYRRSGMQMLAAFVLSLIVFNFWIVPLSMQFSTTFYIAFAAAIILLLYGRTDLHALYIFTATGCVTSYLDLLSTPLITLGLPLIIYLADRDNSKAGNCKDVIRYSAAWLAGYSFIWISKWLLAYLITGYDITDAVDAAVFRTSTAEFNNVDMSLYGLLMMLCSRPAALTALLLLLTAFTWLNIHLFRRNCRGFRDNAWLLVIASMPIIWCLVLRNHSIVHCWFVWRIFIVSFMAYLLFFLRTRAAK